MTVTVGLPTAQDAVEFGRHIGSLLRVGDLVLLAGGLGAGKTTLTKGIAAGLNVDGLVSSPTFVIARTHRGRVGGPGLVHVDAYRLGGRLELDDLDLDSELARSVVVVEWGSGVAEQIADAHLLVTLERHPDDTRTATLAAVGDDWPERLASSAIAASVADQQSGRGCL